METGQSCLSGLGIPQPEQCRLPDGGGAAGSNRQCISDRGIVEQEIPVWNKLRQLSFRMQKIDICFRHFVSDIVESFDLESGTHHRMTLTRSTHVTVRGQFRWFKQAMLYIGLKQCTSFRLSKPAATQHM